MTNQNHSVKSPALPKHHTWRAKLTNSLSLLIIGSGIGWLAGLSVSPVVATIITSLVGVVITLLSVLSGLSIQKIPSDEKSLSNPLWHVNPAPIALLVLGIIIGSICGITTRSQNWLGNDIQAEIQRWKTAGIDEKEIVQRLFNREYPLDGISDKNDAQTDTIKQSVLFAGDTHQSDKKISQEESQRQRTLSQRDISVLNQLPNWLSSDLGSGDRNRIINVAIPRIKLAVMQTVWDREDWGDYQEFKKWIEETSGVGSPPQEFEDAAKYFNLDR